MNLSQQNEDVLFCFLDDHHFPCQFSSTPPHPSPPAPLEQYLYTQHITIQHEQCLVLVSTPDNFSKAKNNMMGFYKENEGMLKAYIKELG